ncbi:MAG TPA: glycoside hydrolase family 3 protein [Candidatus Angelobacter sp.]|nr:glycoside hydrolase family 3 protein [Candidatus Angelobacter sp.]
MKPATAALCAVLIFSSAWAEGPYSNSTPPQLTKDGRRWVEQTLKKLSLEEKVGQMLSVRYFTDFQNFTSDGYRHFRDEMQKYHIGSVVLTDHLDGPVLLKNPPLEVAMMANQLQRDSALPLLIAADFERGIFTRVSPAPAFPDAMAFGAVGNPAYAEKFGAITAQESRALGIHWNFFPVADVNSNPNNPIINTRSFGEDPNAVGDLVAAYIKGARANGMLTTAKHFPGHGDTDVDSHLAVARVGGDLARLRDVELKPFAKAISAGVDSVMIAHVSVPALDPDPNKVATISPAVVAGVLRQQLGFKNLVVTDAMEMRGLTSLYPPEKGNAAGRAAVDAVQAGNDVILLPSDLQGAFLGIVEAVRHGQIPESRIDDSVRRILEMKASLGLHKARLVDLEQVPYLVDKPADMEFAQQVADDAVTLVRDNGKVLPLTPLRGQKTEAEYFQAQVKPAAHVVAIIMTDSIRGPWGRGFEIALKARRADATVFYIDNAVATALAAPVFQAVKDAEKVVIAAYASPVAGKQVMVNGKLVNTVGLEQASGQLLMQVLDLAAEKTVVIALGSPYLAQSYGAVQNYLCTYSNASSSELSAVKALFGELTPHGKLPVTLPGIAERGFSLLPRSPFANPNQR